MAQKSLELAIPDEYSNNHHMQLYESVMRSLGDAGNPPLGRGFATNAEAVESANKHAQTNFMAVLWWLLDVKTRRRAKIAARTMAVEPHVL